MAPPLSWARVAAWRDHLRAVDVGADPGELSAAGAREAWSAALDALSDEALAAAAAIPGGAYPRVAVVTARTVRTAAIEWCALALGRGSLVTLKHPAADAGWAPLLREAAHEAGLPLEITARREAVAAADCVVAMGSDETAAAVQAAAARGARVHAFGHRFSAVWWTGAPVPPDPLVPDAFRDAAGAIAADAALHDGRGCFSPALVLTPLPRDAALDALAEALERAAARWPVGRISPIEGAAIRARRALARAFGATRDGPWGSVHALPAAHAEPAGLPRATLVVPVPDLDAALAAVAPWARWLSSVATDEPASATAWRQLGASRVVAPGRLQRPALDRVHDGVEVLRALVP